MWIYILSKKIIKDDAFYAVSCTNCKKQKIQISHRRVFLKSPKQFVFILPVTYQDKKSQKDENNNIEKSELFHLFFYIDKKNY